MRRYVQDEAEEARHASAHAHVIRIDVEDRLRRLWKRAEVNIVTARSIVQECELLLAENERLRTFIDKGVHPGQTAVRPPATEP